MDGAVIVTIQENGWLADEWPGFVRRRYLHIYRWLFLLLVFFFFELFTSVHGDSFLLVVQVVLWAIVVPAFFVPFTIPFAFFFPMGLAGGFILGLLWCFGVR